MTNNIINLNQKKLFNALEFLPANSIYSMAPKKRDNIKEPSPKIDFLLTKLKELQDKGHSALVFSQFTSFLDILEKDLEKNRTDFLRLDGSTAVGKRKKLALYKAVMDDTAGRKKNLSISKSDFNFLPS